MSAWSGPAPTVPHSLWSAVDDDLLVSLASTRSGLGSDDVRARLATLGPNSIHGPSGRRGWRLLAAQFESPMVLILVAATLVSMALGEVVDGSIILVIVLVSAALGFLQEHRAGRAVDALLAQVRVAVEVLRDGREISVPIEEVVPGDVVRLRAGDVVPGDARLLAVDDLLVDEAVMTGEPFPVEKRTGTVGPAAPIAARVNCVFMGTHVVSGTGEALVARTGRATEFGALAAPLGVDDVTTSFERGMSRFGGALVRLVGALVAAVFVLNVVIGRPLAESFLFSLALAVGLTPQLLPAIVSVSLATGARRMAERRVIVRRLDAIEDVGAMTVLCTDKTGTLTAGAVRLDRALDLEGRDDPEVLRLAALNASLQRNYANAIDDAVVAAGGRPAGAFLDENPYDFVRKRLAVLVRDGSDEVLVVKGAVAQVLEACGSALVAGSRVGLDEVRDVVAARVAALSGGGFRVLAVATKPMPGATASTVADEAGMVLRGLLAFHDPPKDGAAAALARLRDQGVRVVLVTGDNRLAAAHVASSVGLDAASSVVGGEIGAMDDAELAQRCADAQVFAEVEPMHKQRIVAALRASGETVGFLGDGINDAVAIHGADVGISVDTAVDAAKQTAALVLLDKDLDVVSDAVRLGRQTVANTQTYVRVTVSANFGNMLSMAAAAAFLPFLPLLPRQILLLNLLSDVPAMAIAGDAVDPERIVGPQTWDLRAVRDAMLVFGLVSSAFDVATFVVLRAGFGAGETAFRSGWFVESLLTELAALLVLRTRRPFFRSAPSRLLVASSAAVAAVAFVLPYSPLAGLLGLSVVAPPVVGALVALIAGYVATTEVAKYILVRRAVRRGAGRASTRPARRERVR